MKLLFIYNADSGYMNSILDAAHKIVNPSTYKCSLCSLTYDSFSEKAEWKEFRSKFKHHFEFLHKDEFEKKYDGRYDYPVVLDVTGDAKVFIAKAELEGFSSLTDLILRVEKASV